MTHFVKPARPRRLTDAGHRLAVPVLHIVWKDHSTDNVIRGGDLRWSINALNGLIEVFDNDLGAEAKPVAVARTRDVLTVVAP